MTLEAEKFKLIPSSYKGNNFEKIQYDGKDLLQKLRGDFVITKYGQRLQLCLKPVDYEIFDRIHRLAGKENVTCFGGIGISMNKNTPFFDEFNKRMDQSKCFNENREIKMRGCVLACFSSFSKNGVLLNLYAKQVKVSEFLINDLTNEEIESFFDLED